MADKNFCPFKAGNNKIVRWDVREGERLYSEGFSCAEIALRLGVTKTTIAGYARRHWTPAGRMGYERMG